MDKNEKREKQVVLIADDYSDAADLYRVVLTRAGYEVVLASDGREAIARANDCHPDLILMDLCMPEVDGLSATRAIRGDSRTRDIPILALSGHIEASAHSDAREAGCDTVMPKPCLPDELTAKIRKLLPAAEPKRSE